MAHNSTLTDLGLMCNDNFDIEAMETIFEKFRKNREGRALPLHSVPATHAPQTCAPATGKEATVLTDVISPALQRTAYQTLPLKQSTPSLFVSVDHPPPPSPPTHRSCLGCILSSGLLFLDKPIPSSPTSRRPLIPVWMPWSPVVKVP